MRVIGKARDFFHHVWPSAMVTALVIDRLFPFPDKYVGVVYGGTLGILLAMSVLFAIMQEDE